MCMGQSLEPGAPPTQSNYGAGPGTSGAGPGTKAAPGGGRMWRRRRCASIHLDRY